MNIKNKINIFSREYEETLNLYKKMHVEGTEFDDAQNTFDGKSLKFFFHSIKQIIYSTKSNSFIDFGCGKEKYYFENVKIDNVNYNNIADFWKIQKYFLYDPGVKNFSKYPSKKADGVICIDVVEHIPEQDVIKFIEELFRLANKFIFVVIACYPAKKKLPDGRNVHLSIKTIDDWKKIILEIKVNHPHVSPYIICSTSRKKFVAVS